MKIITKIVLDINGVVLEEESYDYGGPVAQCKGGSGGGSSGQVDYPDYMKTWHGVALDNGGVDLITTSITDVMNAAIGNSPFAAALAYDPDLPIAEMVGAPGDLETLVNLLSAGTGLDTIITNILAQTRIDDAVTEYSLDLGDRLTAEVIPRFEAGMRDINSVVSSAFVIGRALIEEVQLRQVSKYSADLHSKAFSDDAIKIIELKLMYQHQLSSLVVETNRMKIVAKKEEAESNLKIDESDAVWDLEVFKYGGNLLASISGAAVSTAKDRQGGGIASAIGGALSGAATGAMVTGGNPIGIAAGAVLGLAAGLLE